MQGQGAIEKLAPSSPQGFQLIYFQHSVTILISVSDPQETRRCGAMIFLDSFQCPFWPPFFMCTSLYFLPCYHHHQSKNKLIISKRHQRTKLCKNAYSLYNFENISSFLDGSCLPGRDFDFLFLASSFFVDSYFPVILNGRGMIWPVLALIY